MARWVFSIVFACLYTGESGGTRGADRTGAAAALLGSWHIAGTGDADVAVALHDLFVFVGPFVEWLEADVRFGFGKLALAANHAPLGLHRAFDHGAIDIVDRAIFLLPAVVELLVFFFALAGQDAVLGGTAAVSGLILGGFFLAFEGGWSGLGMRFFGLAVLL